MKLRGSAIEQEYRRELINSYQSLFSNEGRKDLLDLLKRKFVQMRTAYVLHHIPDQDWDSYTVLINDSTVVTVEIDQDTKEETVVKVISVAEYLHGLKKMGQIQLAVALDLVKQGEKILKVDL